MSDLLIRGMELPENCWSCKMFCNCFACEGYDCHCAALGKDIGTEAEVPRNKRRDDCPLISVPAHGDLVDLSSPFVAQYYDEMKEEWMEKSVTVGDVLHDCMVYGMPPTIIPAEEE